MRVARLFDGKDGAGNWRIDPDRPRIDDPEERERLGRFLAGGVLILRVNGRERDILDPAKEHAVGLSTHTDGTWIWSDGVRYYLVKHGIAPEPELVEHIRSCDYVAAKPDEPVWREALNFVMTRAKNRN